MGKVQCFFFSIEGPVVNGQSVIAFPLYCSSTLNLHKVRQYVRVLDNRDTDVMASLAAAGIKLWTWIGLKKF